LKFSASDLDGKVLAKPLIDESTGEIIADANDELEKIIKKAIEAGISKVYLIFFDGLSVGPYLRNTLLVDKVLIKRKLC
jgi:DNA-directed RNA polymerase subunit beta